MAETPPSPRLEGYISTETLLNLPAESAIPIVDGLLWQGDNAMLVGKEKSGKSIFSLQLACAITSGQDFLGEYEVPKPRVVAYICAEGKLGDLGNNLKRMMKVVDCTPANFGVFYYPVLALDTVEGMKRLKADIDHWQRPEVLIPDPLYLLMQGDLIENKEARRMVASLRELSAYYQATILTNHHEHRPQFDMKRGMAIPESDNSIFGSFVWKAYPDNVFVLMKEAGKHRTLICKTQRLDRVTEVLPLNLQGSAAQQDSLYFEIRTDARANTDKLLYHIPKDNIPISTPELAQLTGWSRYTVWSMLNRLVDWGKVKCTNPGGKPAHWTHT